MKRVVAFFMALTFVFCLLPLPVDATSNTKLEVTVSNAPIRSAPKQEGSVVARCAIGSVLESTGSKINHRMNKWYKVQYNGSTCYIYSGNVKTHSHDYQELYMDGVTYKICNCGDVRVLYAYTDSVTYKRATSFASTASAMALSGYSPYAVAAGGSAVADGPLPIGDAIALLILIYGAYQVMVSSSISDQMLVDIAKEVSFVDYLNDPKRSNVCDDSSFRSVQRMPDGTLHYVDNNCWNVIEAYLLVRYLCTDVYTRYKASAESCASLCPEGYFCEIDANKPDYYYHYHLGPNHKQQLGKHIFYGATPSGLTPV